MDIKRQWLRKVLSVENLKELIEVEPEEILDDLESLNCIDENGFILDEFGNYIYNEDGLEIQVTEEDIQEWIDDQITPAIW